MFYSRVFISFALLLAIFSLKQVTVEALPSCDEDCLSAKLNIIVNKLNELGQKVDGLSSPSGDSQSQGCVRTRTLGHRRFLATESLRHRPGLASATHHAAEDGKCSEKLSELCKETGISDVQLDGKGKAFKVLCDPERWIVIMQRLDGSVNFHNKPWDAYKQGFGDVKSDGEFFVGLQHLHDLTFSGFFELRIDLEDFDGAKKYAHYSDFSIFNERGAYKLGTLGVYHGDAGDSFMYHEGQAFSTIDRDNDAKAVGSCGEEFNSAGWFKSCMEANLMGRYWRGENEHFREGMYWETFRGPDYSLKSVKMSIRAKC